MWLTTWSTRTTVLGLDPLRATDLSQVLGAVAAREPETWVLALPTPGALGSLRGPKELNQARTRDR